jgi:hypothetical protein
MIKKRNNFMRGEVVTQRPPEVEARGGQRCPLPDDDERDHGEVVQPEVEGAAG